MSEIRKIAFGRPWITESEREAVLGVLAGDVLTHGPQAHAFEREFGEFMGGGAHCLTTSSGMAALHLIYWQLGLGPGDEVIVTAQTHVATAHAVEAVGAKAVFVDCEPETGNIDPGSIKVVEDCALAVGTRIDGKHAGLFGDAGIISFYPVKHITTGDGGMFVTKHADFAAKVAKARAFGVDRSFAERSVPGLYDVPTLGINYRMSDINAAIGRKQLERIGTILERRAQNFGRLKDGLSGLKGVRVLDSQSARMVNSHYCLTAVLEGPQGARRNEMVKRLNEQGVGTSIYYPHPVPRLAYYREKYGYDASRFPNATRISDQSIALPVGPHIGPEDMDYIATTFASVLKELS